MSYNKTTSRVVMLETDAIRHFGATTAAFLSQLNYWIQGNKSGVIHQGMRWIFNTAQEWGEQIGISERQVRRIVAELRKSGIILVEKLADYKSNRTNYYTINYDRLSQLYQEQQLSSNASQVARSSGQDVRMVKTKLTNKKNILSDRQDEYQKSGSKSCPSNKSIPAAISTFSKQLDCEAKKTNSIQDMLAYWNAIFPNNAVEMNSNLARLLMAALKTKFNSDMRQWQHYCKTLESSAYLTGKGFNLSIYWALKYVTIERVKVGDFGVKAVSMPEEKHQLEKDYIEQINCLSESERCKEVRMKLLKVYGAYAYRNWFQALKFFVSDEKISYIAPNLFHADYVAREYREILSRV
ncbi:DnaA N-terminal domain-containing protein [Candidatus Odyssella thessalonicensis]|uniref:DnaA N-terminal domain-containing protein n=1 Tax=Candidatus Odyssella thessalonicensis TaxID=84647 RepID=UPI000225ACD5|nr:DnaA N-terminal domain-containing protein [Candidatus Odyssella thessalonicensis]